MQSPLATVSLLVMTLLFSSLAGGQIAEKFRNPREATQESDKQIRSTQARLAEIVGLLAAKLDGEEARRYRDANVLVVVGRPWEGRCNHPANIAMEIHESNSTVLWVCEQGWILSAEAAAAVTFIAMYELSRSGAATPPQSDEFLGGVSRWLEAIIKYYATAHVENHSRRFLDESGRSMCNPWNAAFVLATDRSFLSCEDMAYFDDEALRWVDGILIGLRRQIGLGSDENPRKFVQRTTAYINDALLAYLAAHELAHIVHVPAMPRDGIPPRSPASLMVEKNADAYALQLLDRQGEEFNAVFVAAPALFAMLSQIAGHPALGGRLAPEHAEARMFSGLQSLHCGTLFSSIKDVLQGVYNWREVARRAGVICSEGAEGGVQRGSGAATK